MAYTTCIFLLAAFAISVSLSQTNYTSGNNELLLCSRKYRLCLRTCIRDCRHDESVCEAKCSNGTEQWKYLCQRSCRIENMRCTNHVENCRAVCLMENNDCKKNKMNVNLSIVESTPPNN
uniref:SJCHGC02030 protein n=1 Tax=Schistosoma japonicum TaxID=6182 RepID=Q5DG76_SCHJA|nr:SJCHGC02030 protein [Schistosoma japonicum]